MRRKHFVFIAVLCAFTALTLIACGQKQGDWKEVERGSGIVGIETTPDDFMTIDGNLSETKWGETSTFSHRESNLTYRVNAFYTEKGMYFGMRSIDDKTVTYTKPYAAEKSLNSAFGLFVMQEGDYSVNRRFAAFFDAGNTPRNHGLYFYKSAATVQGGEVNSGKTTGFTVEVFIPWSNIGYDVEAEGGIPNNIRVMTTYRKVSAVNVEGRELYPGLGNGENYGKQYEYTKDGYAATDEDWYELGDAADGYAKSANYDYSEAANGIYGTHNSDERIAVKPNMKVIFKRDAFAENCAFTVKITPDMVNGSVALGGEGAPSLYLIAQTANADVAGFGLDYRASNLSGNIITAKTISYISRQWAIASEAEAFLRETVPGYNLADGLSLTLIKEGSLFYYVLGTRDRGQLIGWQRLSQFSGETSIGILTSNIAVKLSNIGYESFEKTDGVSEELDAALNTLKIRRVTSEANRGGSVTLSEHAVRDGGSVNISALAVTGAYELSRLYKRLGDGEEIDITAEYKAGAVDGVYTVTGVNKNLHIRAEFVSAESVVVKFNVGTASGKFTRLSVYAEGTTDKSKYYIETTVNSAFNMTLPKGTYTVKLIAGGYLTKRESLTVTDGAEYNTTLQLAPYGGEVTVNDKTLSSSARWDLSDSDLAKAYKPLTATNHDSVWLAASGNNASKDFTLSATFCVTNTTDSDPNGGFCISDGTTVYTIFLLHNAVRVYDMTVFAGWQDRSWSALSSAISGSLAGKEVTIELSRTGNVYKFSATYGSVTASRTLSGMTYSWPGGYSGSHAGRALELPTGNVAVGLCGNTGAAVTYSNISYAEAV